MKVNIKAMEGKHIHIGLSLFLGNLTKLIETLRNFFDASNFFEIEIAKPIPFLTTFSRGARIQFKIH